MSKHKQKFSLGRGLDALLGGEEANLAGTTLSIGEIALTQIRPNASQPRREFDPERLEELAASIRSLGLVQPVTLQAVGAQEYMIISGERRWRAAQLAGLETIPAYVRSVPQEQVIEMALVENIQREDLNPIEIALSYQQILEGQEGLTHAALAERIGKTRTTVTNYLRLLRLPAEVQLGLTQRQLEMGHARALLQVEDAERQLELYQMIVQDRLSVREVEELAKALQHPSVEEVEQPTPKPTRAANSQVFRSLELQLSKVFRSKVSLNCNTKGKGKLTIPFASEEELEHIIALLDKLQYD